MRSSVTARTECALYRHRLCIHLFYSIDKLVLAQQDRERSGKRVNRGMGRRRLEEMRQKLLRLCMKWATRGGTQWSPASEAGIAFAVACVTMCMLLLLARKCRSQSDYLLPERVAAARLFHYVKCGKERSWNPKPLIN